MGTTAQKLTYLNETKQELKQAINNLGGSITDETTFRQYVNQLDGVYDVLPKTEFQEGTEVTIENGLKGKIDFDDGKVGFGQASQETTTGTQRINSNENIASTTKNGVTYSLQDGLFTFNGTASAGFDIILSNKVSLEAGAYTMAPSDESGSYTGVFGKYAYVAEVGVGNIIDGGQVRMVANKTLENDYNNKVQLHFYIASGATFNNYKFKVNLVKGTYTSATIPSWEKYTGGYQSPSPNWEQEVKCVAGRNKFDGELEVGGLLNGQNAVMDTLLRSKNYIKVLPNSNYAFSVNSNLNKVIVNFYTSSKTWINRDNNDQGTLCENGIFVTPSNCEYVRFRCYQADYNLFQNGNIQIEQGLTAHPYLPHNTIQETIRGKNELNFVKWLENVRAYGQRNGNTGMGGGTLDSYTDNSFTYTASGNDCYSQSFTMNGTASVNKAFCELYPHLVFEVEPSTYYTLSFKRSDETLPARPMFFYLDENYNYLSLADSGTLNISSFARQTPSNCKYMLFRIGLVGNSGASMTLSNLQLEKGNTTTNYEPYKTPKTYQFSLGNNKFYDECYIVGSPDNWKFVDNYYKEKFSGHISERQISNTSGKYRFVMSTTYNAPPISDSAVADIYSNILKKNSANQNYLRKDSIVINSTGQILFYYEDWAEYSLTEMQNYFANRDDYIVYPLATPIETPITDTTLITQLNNWYYSQSFNGTTIIESNGDLPMIIKVRALKGAA